MVEVALTVFLIKSLIGFGVVAVVISTIAAIPQLMRDIKADLS